MKHKLIICISALCLGLAGNVQAQNKKMYRNGWIDFNKNGVKDIYEDPSQPVEKRVADLLSQMSVEEKTCQLATLYGYGRVLKDSLPVAGWKNEIWKDGIANIDEMLNGVERSLRRFPVYCTLSAIMPRPSIPCNAGLWKKPVWGFPLTSRMRGFTD